jgi:hypothetical protein
VRPVAGRAQARCRKKSPRTAFGPEVISVPLPRIPHDPHDHHSGAAPPTRRRGGLEGPRLTAAFRRYVEAVQAAAPAAAAGRRAAHRRRTVAGLAAR